MEDCIPLLTIIDDSYGRACFDCLSTLDIHFLQFAVECEVFSMLYQYALVVSWHYQNLFYDAIKYTQCFGILVCGYVHTIVEWKLDCLEYWVV